MIRLKFRLDQVEVEQNTTEVKVLETPTFLKKLYFSNRISLDAYNEKMYNYNKAIELKDTLPDVSEGSELQLRDYQQQIVDYAKHLRSFAIFDEPRLGKTPTVLKLLEAKNLQSEKIIIAAPNKVIGNWIKEAKIWIKKEAIRYDGGEIPKDKNILVMTYERIRLSLNDLIKWKPKVFILDEAHMLRNSKGARQRLTEAQREIKETTGLIPRNQSILKLAKKVKHRYPLSGTPSVNRPDDIFAILQFQMPNIFDSYWNFVYYYFDVRITHWGNREIIDYKSNDKKIQFQELLNYVSSNNKQEEHMKWLIQPKITKKEIPLNKTQLSLEYDLIENGQIGDQFILTELESYTHYATLVINPSLLPSLNEKNLGAKNEYLLNKIKDIKYNIAIFSSREQNLQKLKQEIETKYPKRELFIMTGSTSDKQSIEIQNYINDKGNKDKGIIFLGSILACKEGISLQGLKKAFITDQVWVATDMTQLFNRLNATTPENQKIFGTKEITILHSPDTIDDIIEEALVYKKSITEIVNDYKLFIERRKKWKSLN